MRYDNEQPETYDVGLKHCACCKESKPLFSFSRNRAKKDGLQTYCKTCYDEKLKKYKDKKAQYQQNYKVNNLEKHQESSRKATQKWKSKNRARATAWENAREAGKIKATPAWLSEFDKIKITCLYQVARMRSEESDQMWHVDHVVPLRSKKVCGLHVPWNLQVIPAKDNMLKSNKFEVL